MYLVHAASVTTCRLLRYSRARVPRYCIHVDLHVDLVHCIHVRVSRVIVSDPARLLDYSAVVGAWGLNKIVFTIITSSLQQH